MVKESEVQAMGHGLRVPFTPRILQTVLKLINLPTKQQRSFTQKIIGFPSEIHEIQGGIRSLEQYVDKRYIK